MEYVACNLCGSTDTRVRFPDTIGESGQAPNAERFQCTSSGYGKHRAIVECNRCRLVYSNPRPSQSELIKSYEAVEDSLYLQERAGRVLTFSRNLVPIEKITGPACGRKLLDVGCYTGIFLDIAARVGWEAWGVDPSRWAVAQARERGLNVIEGTLAALKGDDGSFDVVTMWDVIEHVADPLDELFCAWRLLRPGGLLVAHTMDIDSLFARIMGSRWPWLMEMHIYFFSRETLRAMLEKAGFRVLRVVPQGRYQTLGYLGTRITALFGSGVGRPIERLIRVLGLGRRAVSINLGDLVTAYAIKAESDLPARRLANRASY